MKRKQIIAAAGILFILLMFSLSSHAENSQLADAWIDGELMNEKIAEHFTGSPIFSNSRLPYIATSMNEHPKAPAASETSAEARRYHINTLPSDIATIPWHTTVLVGSVAVVGFANWDWGNSDFNFNDEGFFDEDTGSLGMDKLGHAYSTYVMTDYFNHFMIKHGASPYAPYNAALLSWGVMLGVEVFDGFSSDHGFSYEDLIFNFFGAGFSVVRNTVPGLRERLDFRVEYLPSGNVDGFHPFTDYSGQKYLLALKLSGFDSIKETPLRFVEFHGGYFARGFTEAEEEQGDQLRRELYAAVGINLSELFFGKTTLGETTFGRVTSRFLEYVQIPYTYVATVNE